MTGYVKMTCVSQFKIVYLIPKADLPSGDVCQWAAEMQVFDELGEYEVEQEQEFLGEILVDVKELKEADHEEQGK